MDRIANIGLNRKPGGAMEIKEALLRMDAAIRKLDADQKRVLIDLAMSFKRVSTPLPLQTGPELPDLLVQDRGRSE